MKKDIEREAKIYFLLVGDHDGDGLSPSHIAKLISKRKDVNSIKNTRRYIYKRINYFKENNYIAVRVDSKPLNKYTPGGPIFFKKGINADEYINFLRDLGVIHRVSDGYCIGTPEEMDSSEDVPGAVMETTTAGFGPPPKQKTIRLHNLELCVNIKSRGKGVKLDGNHLFIKGWVTKGRVVHYLYDVYCKEFDDLGETIIKNPWVPFHFIAKKDGTYSIQIELPIMSILKDWMNINLKTIFREYIYNLICRTLKKYYVIPRPHEIDIKYTKTPEWAIPIRMPLSYRRGGKVYLDKNKTVWVDWSKGKASPELETNDPEKVEDLYDFDYLIEVLQDFAHEIPGISEFKSEIKHRFEQLDHDIKDLNKIKEILIHTVDEKKKEKDKQIIKDNEINLNLYR